MLNRPAPVCLVSVLLICLSTLVCHAQNSVMNLAFVLPQNRPNLAPAQSSSSLSDSAKYGTDIAVVGTGALIASDDRGMYRTVQGPDGLSPGVESIGHAVSDLGNVEYVGPALGLLYLGSAGTNREIAWRSGAAIIKAGIVGNALKFLVGRKRPSGAQGGSADSFHPLHPADAYDSFPSGHTLVAFSVASVWATERPSEAIEAYGLASLVGASRIVVHAHWPSDVFWGAVIGLSQGRRAAHGNVNLLDIRF